MLANWKNLIIDLFFPKECLVCGRGDEHFCLTCQKKIVYLKDNVCLICNRQPSTIGICSNCQPGISLDQIIVSVRYKGTVIEKIIHEYKFNFIEELAEFLANLLLEKISHQNVHLDHTTIVCPIPLHPKRFAERGFNQSAVLAQFIAKGFGCQYQDKTIVRSKYTDQQAKLNRSERIDNLHQAFTINNHELKNKTIVLVDDVITSGTTMNEAAKCLKQAGAATVIAMAVAHN
ncbi:hypothetical protein COT97_00805 [Candidatus Falkowbacteria bacterium CG10_big_fil_rev_8_21_14_0_10_39_11]|uniref:Phosphoribosyltransferase domain-containing protein n=1 Tax=Candidatus Falkowbacteria bacterium CG10_big_fil_rev_8_21_14_0_10_39_11 TaxID=1974565 RepID=A0A2H0V666_9BACT|nr:MAG: hypothetical protein COT97_00805 [Candidatus Falkowbacteria bacterium CG10_big_fil_rev_8_21_14_0_10_39_11]